MNASSDGPLGITVVDSSLPLVDQAVDRIFQRWGVRERFVRTETRRVAWQPVADIPAGGAHLFCVELACPDTLENRCVVRANIEDGWHSLALAIARELRGLQLQVLSTRARSEFPRHRFELWRGGVRARLVQALRDSDKWCFSEAGVPEYFEDVTRYKARLISKRIDRELLRQYVAALGWKVALDEFKPLDSLVVQYDETRKH